jgi:hypothetical protein
MIAVRTTIEIRQGVKVELLFTPRLYAFKGHKGMTLKGDTQDLAQVYALYADLLFCAALNAWTLEGNDIEDAQFKRIDFHEWSATNPQAFGKAISFALKALSGKSLEEFINEEEKSSKIERKSANKGAELKKKSLFRLIMQKLKPSL